jgi:hypothetical protein
MTELSNSSSPSKSFLEILDAAAVHGGCWAWNCCCWAAAISRR